MRRFKYLFPVFCLIFLTACGTDTAKDDNTVTNEPPVHQQEELVFEAPVYIFENFTKSDSFVREDTGEESAVYSYSLPSMSIANEKSVSNEDRELALRNVEAFNRRMEEIMAELVAFGKQVLEEQKFLVETENVPFAVCDEVVGSTIVTGQIVSVVARCYYYGGGAHPNTYTVTHLFDLSVGQFIDPTQIGDDPESFRIGAAELLIQQAESMGEEFTSGLWADYREVISRWNETSVYFTENGMTVFFSAYELGPYAMGPVELVLSYDELTNLLGEGGLAHLGIK